ncbi:MAG: adenylate/guanylate cyclase domain-containing protein, partial [Hyphomicrobiales bacterium]
MERRLAAIFVADAVGYSRLMGEDEEATLRALKSHRLHIDETIANYGGRVFGSAGDSVIAEFKSAVEAVRCAVDVQQGVAARNNDVADEQKLRFRIGIHLGDVMADGDNLLGDGVNIAARLEALAPADGISISKIVAQQTLDKIDVEFVNAGSHQLKNIAQDVDVWMWPPELAKMIPNKALKRRRMVGLAMAVAAVALATFFYFTPNDEAALPSGPRIVVTPFKNIGTEAADTYFSDGLTRDLNSMLANFSNLFVIAPEATTEYRDGVNCKKISEELGADYILSGAVQRSEKKIRVTTNFTDAKTCRQLTSPGPFEADLSVSNVMEIQVEIARKVAAQIGSSDAPIFKSAIVQSLRDKAPGSMAAYECYLLSYWFYETWAVEDFRRARDCLLETVREEPNYSLGWSRLAFSHIESKKRGHDTQPDWDERARQAADTALKVDRDNPDA